MNDAPGWHDSEQWLRDAAGAVLRLAAAGDNAGAAQALERLFALRGRFHAYPILQDMLAGRRSWRAAGSVHVLGGAEAPPALLRHFDEAVEACSSFLGLPPPCILLQCVPGNHDMHLTMESLPGLALVRLSTGADGFQDGLRAVVYHEAAHCFLTCGVRLLDEGLAQLFANRFGGATPLPPHPELVPPLAAMLSRDGDAMFGAAGDGNPAVYRAACRAGADLLQAVDARGGGAAIVALFRAVARAPSDARIAALVEEASGVPLTAQVATSADTAACGPEASALVERVREAILAAWSTKRVDELASGIAMLEAEPVLSVPALLDTLLSARLNQALLQVHGGGKLPDGSEARIDALLKAADILPAGRLWLWRGVRAILTILLARPNIIKVATAGQHALHAFGKAQELIPRDPDLLIHHASLLLHAPPDYGGDRDRGAGMLREAMQHPLYRAHAREMMVDNGIDPGDQPLDLSAPAAVPPAAREAAPPMLEASGVELRLPSGFLLQPGQLVLRAGERVALVGPNGSGKTMLLETLLGLRTPDRGQVRLAIGDPRDPKVRQQLGGLLQGADLPGQMRVGEAMALHEAIYEHTEPAVTRALGMDELRGRLWQQLSRGQKQRLMLWLALSHVPALVLLDEPTLGLDEWYARALRELLAGLTTTVLQISHVGADLPAMDRILCMERGRLVDGGALDELLSRRVGRYKARIGQTLKGEALQAMQALPALLRAEEAGDGWQLQGGEGFDAAFRGFIGRHGIAHFSLEASTVEDFLAHLAQGDNA